MICNQLPYLFPVRRKMIVRTSTKLVPIQEILTYTALYDRLYGQGADMMLLIYVFKKSPLGEENRCSG